MAIEAATAKEEGEEHSLWPPRLKPSADLEWTTKEFLLMTREERNAYAVFAAVGHLGEDRFLSTRGLLAAACEQGTNGLVDAGNIFRALERMRIKHGFAEADIEGILRRLLSDAAPRNDTPAVVETAELEKAVERVRKDKLRRLAGVPAAAPLAAAAAAADPKAAAAALAAKNALRTSTKEAFGLDLGYEARRLEGTDEGMPSGSSITLANPAGRRTQVGSKENLDSLQKGKKGLIHGESPADAERQIRRTLTKEEALLDAENIEGRGTLKGTEARPDLCPDPEREQKEAAFGFESFVETLLRIGVQHMHASGIVIQASSPGGVKALWLITFLHYRFDDLLRKHRGVGTAAGEVALLAAKAAAKKREAEEKAAEVCSDLVPSAAQPAANLAPSAERQKSGNRLWVPGTKTRGASAGAPGTPIVGRPEDKKERVDRSRFLSSPAALDSAAAPATEPDYKAASASGAKEVANMPEGASYKPCLAQLLNKHPDLFDNWIQDVTEEQRQLAGSTCENCGRVRNAGGIGSVFCHTCSGVDDKPLHRSLLFPVLSRQRLREELCAREERLQTEAEAVEALRASEVGAPPAPAQPTIANVRSSMLGAAAAAAAAAGPSAGSKY